ncbi:hypothetical protein RJE46_14155 [Cedecea neteri]|uniref:hypothetical protein n=1 Tax=Cedecea neteri TaxID=158822 RepID=UPI0028938017|nr:hypothetical protein [Cedecea neteri]WNJ77775.1 hypothetical protein RJE46_14155 [Cedecea neteri]
MSVITKSTATVYFSPAKGRRYLSKSAAIHAETKAIIFSRYPIERQESDSIGVTHPGYNIAYDEPERFAKLYRRLRRIVARSVADIS